MEIKIECPRCQTFMTLSADKGGQYTSCSNCGGKVWVPKQAARSARPASAATPVRQPAQQAAAGSPAQPVTPQSANGGVPPQAPPSQPKARQQQPADAGSVRHEAGSVRHETGGVRHVAPQPQRKVAKFITADVANSSLAIAGDGKLPELHLERNDDKKKRDPAEKQGSRPWLLALVVCGSVAISVLLLMTPSPGTPQANTRVDQARERIKDVYFGDSAEQLAPYQILLREAHLAHSRGDTQAEEASYRRVLALLRDESLLRPDRSPRGQKGLTGSRLRSGNESSRLPSDEDLQEQISILLRDLR